MTNGEAVNWLINISADIGKAEHRDLWHYEQALYEIRDMLESAQPETDGFCTDCKEYDQERHFCPRFDRVIKTTIDEMKTEQRWIPVTERLPEEDTEVLISYRYKEGEGDTDHVNIDITSYGTTCFGGREIHTLKEWRQPFDYFHANYEVIAWMPLPTPYREE